MNLHAMGEKPAKEKEEKEEEMVSEFGSKFSPGTAARAGQEWTSEDNDRFEKPGEKKPEEEEDDDEAYQGDMVPESKEQLRQWKAMSAAIAAGTVSEESTFAPGTPWTNARSTLFASSRVSRPPTCPTVSISRNHRCRQLCPHNRVRLRRAWCGAWQCPSATLPRSRPTRKPP